MAAVADLTIGYAAALEQFSPTDAVRYTALAESHGFSGCMAADHFAPWVPAQGQASFVWSVLAAVGERTTGDLGPGVTSPSFRFHPAVVAQASATLAAMYPGRYWLGVGAQATDLVTSRQCVRHIGHQRLAVALRPAVILRMSELNPPCTHRDGLIDHSAHMADIGAMQNDVDR